MLSQHNRSLSTGSNLSQDLGLNPLDVDAAVAHVQMESEDEAGMDVADIGVEMETSFVSGGNTRASIPPSTMDFSSDVKENMSQLSQSIAEVQTVDGQLFEAKVAYQREVTEARRKLYKMYKVHRGAIEKSKPFFVAKELEKQMGLELDQVEAETEMKRFNFEDAKENEQMAEQALELLQQRPHDFSEPDHHMILENWNRATQKVLEASRQRADCEDTLRRKEIQFMTAQNTADQILADLKTAVQKAWPYYSMKEQFEKELEKKKQDVHKYGRQLTGAKEKYKKTFARLNLVSTEIQQRRYLKKNTNNKDAGNLSQFHEVTNIDSVLCALESKAEDLATTVDHMKEMEEEDNYYGRMGSAGLADSKGPMARSQSLLTFSPAGEDYRARRSNLAESRGKSFTGSTTSLDLDKKIKAELKKSRLARESTKRLSLDVQNESLMHSVSMDNGDDVTVDDPDTVEGPSSGDTNGSKSPLSESSDTTLNSS